MSNTQGQATQCHRHGKEFKQWWSTAKYTLKCDEHDAMEIWLASQSINQSDMLKALAKDYQELTKMYIQQGMTIAKLQNRIDTALWHLEDHEGYDDLTHVIKILKGE